MRTTTFICDLCKKSVGETELCQVSTSIKMPKQDRGMKLASCDKDVCKDCLTKKGLIVEYTGDDKERSNQVAKNQKTLEDKLIDILEDLGVSFGE